MHTHVCSTQVTLSSACNVHISSFYFPKDTKRKRILRINKLRDERSLKQWNHSLKKTCKNFVPLSQIVHKHWLDVCSICPLETSRPILSPAHQLSTFCHGLSRHIQIQKVDFIPEGHWHNMMNLPWGKTGPRVSGRPFSVTGFGLCTSLPDPHITMLGFRFQKWLVSKGNLDWSNGNLDWLDPNLHASRHFLIWEFMSHYLIGSSHLMLTCFFIILILNFVFLSPKKL